MRRFLTAEWRHLAMINYPIDQALLLPHLPAGTELDTWNGESYLSVVGFMFRDVRVLGMPIPFHRTFEEVNLRFYVRRHVDGEWRRGVVFIREIVPRRAVAFVARAAYNENYVAWPMDHRIEILSDRGEVAYRWYAAERWNALTLQLTGTARPIAAGSEEEFITEHYWGYAGGMGRETIEYRVDHPRWNVWQVEQATLDCDVARVYGPAYAPFLEGRPSSAFVADGSAITVFRGATIA